MIKIERPLLLIGKHRPSLLFESQLLLIRQLTTGCFVFLGVAAVILLSAGMSSWATNAVLIAMLFAASLPGIVLEYFLEKNVKSGREYPHAHQTCKLYSTDILQLGFVAILAAFVIGVAVDCWDRPLAGGNFV